MKERGQALYELMEKHIEQLEGSGLSIIEAATAYGKTTQVKKYILNNYKNQKFMLIAPQKKLFLEFKEEELIDNQDLEIICLLPVEDTFKSFFSHNKNFNPPFESEIFGKIKSLINNMNENSGEVKEILLKDFLLKEKIFRNELKAYISREPIFDKENRDLEKIKLFFDKNKWIQELYPSVMIPFAQLIQLTASKVYYSVDTIWQGTHEIHNNFDPFFNNYIIFVDEIDSTKQAIQQSIINDISRKQRIDVFSAIQHIFKSLKSLLNNEIILPEDFYGGIDGYIQGPLNKFIETYEKDYLKYNLNCSTKYEHDTKKDRFLFRDDETIDIKLHGETLYIRYDEENRINEIVLGKDLEDAFQLSEVYNFISRCLFEFVKQFSTLCNEYYKYHNEKIKPYEEEISLFDAIKTIIYELRLGSENCEYFSNLIFSRLSMHLKKDDRDGHLNFLQSGFEYNCMLNGPDHDLSTVLHTISYPIIPEHIIARICRNNLMMGFSATANIQTYYRNYDYHYLNSILKNKLVIINEEEQKLLEENFHESRNHKVSTEIMKFPKIKNFDQFYEQVHDMQITNSIPKEMWFNVFYLSLETMYRLEYYLRLIDAFDNFCKKKCKAFLSFINFDINKTSEINEKLLFELLEKQAQINYGIQVEIRVLKSINFDDDYEDIKKTLKNQEVHMFMISTYNTISLGKNLQYKEKYFIGEECIDREVDLDGIYLDTPTCVIPQVYKEDEVSLANYLFTIEYLKSEKIIKKKSQFYNLLSNGFSYFFRGFGTGERHISEYTDKAICKIIIQSIGRICRTKNKKDNLICITDELKDLLARNYDYLIKRMNNYEFEVLLEECRSNKKKILSPSYITENYYNLREGNFRITYLSFRWWNELKREEWINLRDMVLRYPTTSVVNEENKKYYFYFEEPLSAYNYHIKSMSDNLLEIYNFNSSEYYDKYSRTVSIAASRLQYLLEIPEVKDYFEKHNYATEFVSSNYIINSGTFERIYKGAVGEVAGVAILGKYGIHLEPISELKHFERFDYKLGNIYFDFKNWSNSFSQLKSTVLPKIIRKAKEVGAKKVFIINVLKNDFDQSHKINVNDLDIKIYEIPWLYDPKTKEFNNNEIANIILEVSDEGNINE